MLEGREEEEEEGEEAEEEEEKPLQAAAEAGSSAAAPSSWRRVRAVVEASLLEAKRAVMEQAERCAAGAQEGMMRWQVPLTTDAQQRI